ncbi:MAG: hypothetical protein JXR76_18330 [Deltaproteobacteria bacterium]|nr:hypothetical protein [Deltaproteobacteria bacterium]
MERLASIILLTNGDMSPDVAAVEKKLTSDLKRLRVQIQVDKAAMPRTATQWSDYTARKAKETPGLLAVFSWNCLENNVCYLHIVEAQSLAHTSIPVGVVQEDVPNALNGAAADTSDVVTEDNIAAGIREVMYSEYLFDVPKIANQANHPKTAAPSRPAADYLRWKKKDALDENALLSGDSFRPPANYDRSEHPIWMEFGYLGAFPYPASRTIHGIMLGLTFYLHKHFAPTIRVGGLARRRDSGMYGTINAYNMPVGLYLRFPINIGQATFSIAPVAQFDIIWSRADTFLHEKLDKYFLDLSVGGETTWHLPMPGRDIELFVGAGILATFFSDTYTIYDENVMPDTSLQFYWLAGVSKNLFMH